MGHGKAYTDAEIEEIKGYLKDGCNNSEIAELMGRSICAIQQLAVRMGWTHGRFKDDDANSKQRDEILKRQAEPSIQFPGQVEREPVAEVTEETKQTVEVMQDIAKPVKEKTLNDFSPRELIKNLYDRGYRIENGRLICIVHQVVNLKDIING